MLQNKTCLIIEDHAQMRRFIAAVLKNQLDLPNPLQVSDAEAALRILKDPPDGVEIGLIICDWGLPGMSGDEFLLQVRSLEGYSDIPFILETGNNSKDLVITAIQAGVTDFLIKPYSAKDLVSKIKRVTYKASDCNTDRYLVDEKYPVQIRSASATCHGELVNVSDRGCCVSLNRCGISIPVENEDVTLDLHLGGDTIALSGKAKGLSNNPLAKSRKDVINLGFEFLQDGNELPKAYQSLLNRCKTVAQQAKKKPPDRERKRFLDIED